MSGQLAKLFIRGSLVNVTAKNLTKSQKEEVDKLIQTVWKDKTLDTTKHKFCNVLSCTIGNEYKDKEFAMNEIWITIWRTAVDVLYHHPRPNVVNDINARRKYFKQCIYMYMRQILNENKIPSYRYEKTIDGDANIVACEIIQFYFDNSLKKFIDYSLEEIGKTFKFTVKIDNIPRDMMSKIWKLKDEVRDFGALMVITDESITIIPEGEVKNFHKKISEKARVSHHSMSGFQDEEDNSFQQHCEHKALKNTKREVELDSMLVQDSVEVLLSRLPATAAKVCKILVDTPKDFLDKYYPKRKKPVRPKEAHIAEYLCISKSEVSKAMDLIKRQAIALDIG